MKLSLSFILISYLQEIMKIYSQSSYLHKKAGLNGVESPAFVAWVALR